MLFGCSAPQVLISVDGACEDGVVTIGAVVVVQVARPEALGARVGQELVDSWKTRDAQTQVIGQAELFPLLVARLTWGARLQGRKALYFVDNNAALQAMIRSYSPVLPSLELVMECLKWDLQAESSAWYARVPTECNPADAPSRMKYEGWIREAEVQIVQPIFPKGQPPCEIMKMGGGTEGLDPSIE